MGSVACSTQPTRNADGNADTFSYTFTGPALPSREPLDQPCTDSSQRTPIRSTSDRWASSRATFALPLSPTSSPVFREQPLVGREQERARDNHVARPVEKPEIRRKELHVEAGSCRRSTTVARPFAGSITASARGRDARNSRRDAPLVLGPEPEEIHASVPLTSTANPYGDIRRRASARGRDRSLRARGSGPAPAASRATSNDRAIGGSRTRARDPPRDRSVPGRARAAPGATSGRSRAGSGLEPLGECRSSGGAPERARDGRRPPPPRARPPRRAQRGPSRRCASDRQHVARSSPSAASTAIAEREHHENRTGKRKWSSPGSHAAEPPQRRVLTEHEHECERARAPTRTGAAAVRERRQGQEHDRHAQVERHLPVRRPLPPVLGPRWK